MAMVKCKECGKEISTGAAKCPHCGKSITKPMIVVLELIAGILFIVVVWCLLRLFGVC